MILKDLRAQSLTWLVWSSLMAGPLATNDLASAKPIAPPKAPAPQKAQSGQEPCREEADENLQEEGGSSYRLKLNSNKKSGLQKKSQKPCQEPTKSSTGGSSQGGQAHDKSGTETGDDGEEGGESRSTPKGTGTVDLPLSFPGWEPEDFDMSFEPIMDQQIGRKTLTGTPERKVDTFAAELGGNLLFEHIPIFSGPFTWNATLLAGIARGRDLQYDLSLTKVQESIQTKQPFELQKNHLFKRTVFELTQDFYIDWLRPRIKVGYGKLDWDHLGDAQSLKSKLIGFGLGVKLPAVLEGWGEWHRYTAYYEKEKDPILTETDGSLTLGVHLKKNDINYDLDTGVGMSRLAVYSSDGADRAVIGEGLARSLRLTGSATFTESLRAEFSAKYSFAASDGLEAAYNALRLPSQRLNRAPLVASTPEDDFTARAFVGAVDWVKDLTIGWAYFNQIKNFSKGLGAVSREQQSGPFFEYQYSF